jgi:sarcosine oxidase subunit gamma
MVEAYLRRSPLTHRGLAAKATAAERPERADIVMGERPHRCQIDIRGDADDASFAAAIHSVTGLPLPTSANSFTALDEMACLWLGPDEWLILGPGGDESGIAARLMAAFGDSHAAAVDVSESRTTIAVSGPRAGGLLAKGTSIDLHPRAFGRGRCVQTGFAGANVILRQVDDAPPSFEILVLNSFAEHLWVWLDGACREFSVAVAS